MPDMYAGNELADARHVIEWLARQPWCDGQVGMFGTSWGGTASLQAGVNAPSALKAVIAVCATHDRYTDDIHHMGGCVLTDTVEWGATLPAILASPPTSNAGPAWQDLWRDRIRSLGFPLEAWLQEDGRTPYWRHGSVVHQTDRLSVPVLAVGGWSDRYSNSVMSMVDARPDLVWGVVGPWGHHYPDQGHPGPAIGFQHLALEWWDAWLKPQTGRTRDWPRLRVWLRQFQKPADALENRTGQWIQSGPPKDETTRRSLRLSSRGLCEDASGGPWKVPDTVIAHRAAGDTGYFGRFGGLPLDQSVDDANALVLETQPLEQDLIVYGAATFSALVGQLGEPGQIVLRLSDVAPDGTANRIAYAVRNLALDDTLVPDKGADRRTFKIDLHTTAYRIAAGHRLRLAISGSFWPLVWPAYAGGAPEIMSGQIDLPVLAGPPQALTVPMPTPRTLPEEKSYDVLAAPALARWHDETEDAETAGWHQPWTGLFFRETQTTFGFQTSADYALFDDAAAMTVDHQLSYQRPDGVADVASVVSVRADRTSYRVIGSLKVTWNGEPFENRDWDFVVPRGPLRQSDF